MKVSEARAIVGTLSAAFPSANIGRETEELYTAQIAKLQSTEAAVAAVQEVIAGQEWFPSFASFREAYGRHAKRLHDQWESEQRRAAEERGLPEGERPPVPKIAWDFLASLGSRKGEPEKDTLEGLEQLPGGRCDDCHEFDKHAPRYTIGEVTVCRPCAASRIRARFQAEKPLFKAPQLPAGGVPLPLASGNYREVPNENWARKAFPGSAA